MKNKKLFKLKALCFSAILLSGIASQSASAQNNALQLSQSEMLNIINGKIAKVQASRRYVAPRKQVYKRPARRVVNQHARKQAQQKRAPARRYVRPVQQRAAPRPYVAPRYVAPRAPTSSIPAWRRPASHTETRGSGDAIFAAAKNRNMALLQQILASGVNVNHANFNGETALHIAASQGNIGMVQFLVNKGANVNARTGKQWMPIHHAMRFGHPQVANFLISRKASVWGKNTDGRSAIDLAKTSKNPHIRNIAKRYGH